MNMNELIGMGIGLVLIGCLYLAIVQPWKKYEVKTYPLYLIEKRTLNDGTEEYVVLINKYNGRLDDYDIIDGSYATVVEAADAMRSFYNARVRSVETVGMLTANGEFLG